MPLKKAEVIIACLPVPQGHARVALRWCCFLEESLRSYLSNNTWQAVYFWDITICLGWWCGAQAEEISPSIALSIIKYCV